MLQDSDQRWVASMDGVDVASACMRSRRSGAEHANHINARPRPARGRARVALILASALVALAACSGPTGEKFADVDAIALSETWRDWVVVGRFGAHGPFRVTDIKYCEFGEACTFSHDGQGHTYSRFRDHKLTILRLEGPSGAVSHVVMRSRYDKYGNE